MKLETVDMAECPPSSHSKTVDFSVTASCSTDAGMEDDVWVKCDRHNLKITDKGLARS